MSTQEKVCSDSICYRYDTNLDELFRWKNVLPDNEKKRDLERRFLPKNKLLIIGDFL
jgi:hypothetical protein